MPRVAESGGRKATEWSRFGDWGLGRSNYEDFLPPSTPSLGSALSWDDLSLGRPDRSPLQISQRAGRNWASA